MDNRSSDRSSRRWKADAEAAYDGRMRSALVASSALLLVAAAVAPARADDCEKACTHMRTVSEAELARAPGMSLDDKKRIQERSTANEPTRMQKCLAGCREGRVDTACVLRATDTMGYLPCLKSRNAPPRDTLESRVTEGVRASAEFRGKALPAAERAKILDALAKIDRSRAHLLLGAALAESGGPMYGDDLVPAFRAIANDVDGSATLPRLLEPLTLPLAQLGCARAVADAVRLPPPQARRQVAATCPKPPAARVVDPAVAPSLRMERLLLAIVLDGRARQSGLASDPLHLRAMQILLRP